MTSEALSAKRSRRLVIMSAALSDFSAQKANVARRSASDARDMRFAADARRLIKNAKIRLANEAQLATAKANILQSEADLRARFTPEQRDQRVRDIIQAISDLQYAPFGVSIAPKRAELQAEMAILLAAEPAAAQPVTSLALGLVVALQAVAA